MKSGTNQYHGSGYDYFQNADLNAGIPFTINPDGTGLVRNPLNRNDYGFTLGGPISIPKLYNGKDKTFFFFNFEQFRQSVTVTNLIATAPMPQWTGADPRGANFGPTLANGQPNPGNIENPLGPFLTAGFGTPLSDGPGGLDWRVVRPTNSPLCEWRGARFRIRRNPFPNNIIPYSRMDPSRSRIRSYFIKPTQGGLANNSASAGLLQLPAHHDSLDQDRSERQLENQNIRILFRRRATYSPNANGFTNLEEPATPQVQALANHPRQLRPNPHAHPVAASGRRSSVLRRGAQYPPSVNAGQVLGWAANQQYPANNFMPKVAGLSSFFEGGLNAGAGLFAPTPGVGFAADQDEKEYKPTANINMTWVKGNHTFKVGRGTGGRRFPHAEFQPRQRSLYLQRQRDGKSLGVYQHRAIPRPQQRRSLRLRIPLCQLPVGIGGLSTLPRLPIPAGQT
jgi:hypothetical protein